MGSKSKESIEESFVIFTAQSSLLSALVSYLVKSHSSAESLRILFANILVDEEDDVTKSCFEMLSIDCMALLMDLVSKCQNILPADENSLCALLQLVLSLSHLFLNMRAKAAKNQHTNDVQRSIDDLSTLFYQLLPWASKPKSSTLLNVLQVLLR